MNTFESCLRTLRHSLILKEQSVSSTRAHALTSQNILEKLPGVTVSSRGHCVKLFLCEIKSKLQPILREEEGVDFLKPFFFLSKLTNPLLEN